MSSGPVDHVHIYVDASFEPNGFSGVGGLRVDSRGEVLGCFSEEVPKELIVLIQAGDKDAAILQLEMAAISVAVRMWKYLMFTKRVVVGTERNCQIKQFGLKECLASPAQRMNHPDKSVMNYLAAKKGREST